MMPYNKLVLLLFFGFLAGIISAQYYSGGRVWLYIIVIVFIAAVLMSMYYKNKQLGIYNLIALFYVLGIIHTFNIEMKCPLIVQYFGQTVMVSGEVCGNPQITKADGQNGTFRYVIAVDNIIPEGQDKSYHHNSKVVVYLNKGIYDTTIVCGQKIVVRGKLLPINSYKNPGSIDTAAVLWHQQIYARISKPEIIAAGQQSSLCALFQRLLFLRYNIVPRIEKVLEKSEASELTAFLFGGYDGISKDIVKDLTATGLIHIVSVSGSHIALIAAAFLWVGRQLRLRDGASIFLAIYGIVTYAVITGFTPPVVRSLIMGILSLLAIILRRDGEAAVAFAVAGIGMLIYQPGLIYDVSFQLSFGATAGLIFVYPRIYQALQFLPEWCAMPAAVTIAAQLGVLPFLAWYFNTISLSALLANMLVLPFIEIVIIMGLCGVILLFIFPVFGEIAIWCCGQFINFTNLLLRILASMTASSVYLPALNLGHGLAYYCLLAWFCEMHPRYIPKFNATIKKYWLQITISCILWAWAVILYPAKDISVHFIDVGQGDATLLITPQKHAILIDTGGSPNAEVTKFDVGERVIIPYLKHHGVHKLDYLILTHGHQDHAGGAAAVAACVPVDNFLLNKQEKTEAIQALLNNLPKGKYINSPYEGQVVTIDGVKITVLKSNEGEGKGNETCNVVKIKFGEVSFLITGDLQAREENELIDKSVDVTATVLKIGHHGSKTSSTSEFLQAVAPRYAVISVGSGNRFGHPSLATLERLRQQNIKVFRTDRDGAVTFRTDGLDLRPETYQ